MAGGGREKRDKDTNIWWLGLVLEILLPSFTHLHTHTPPSHTSLTPRFLTPLPHTPPSHPFSHPFFTHLPHIPPSHTLTHLPHTPPSHPSLTHPSHTSDPLPNFTHTHPSHTHLWSLTPLPPSHPSLTQVLMTYLHSMLPTCSFETQSPSLQRNWSRAWKMNQTTLRSVRADKLTRNEAVPTSLDSI